MNNKDKTLLTINNKDNNNMKCNKKCSNKNIINNNKCKMVIKIPLVLKINKDTKCIKENPIIIKILNIIQIVNNSTDNLHKTVQYLVNLNIPNNPLIKGVHQCLTMVIIMGEIWIIKDLPIIMVWIPKILIWVKVIYKVVVNHK